MSESLGARQAHGKLEIICGPMFSGKSEELIRRLRRAQYAKLNVLTCKHRLDDRHMIECVVTHDGKKMEAEPIEDVADIARLGSDKNIDVIGIDEAQWFDNELITTVCRLVDSGKRVIIAGLDLDFRGVPFGCMPTLLAIADEITKLRAICCVCGADAHFTQRLVGGVPAKHDDPVILVGAEEAYQARCRNCHSIDKRPTFQSMRQWY